MLVSSGLATAAGVFVSAFGGGLVQASTGFGSGIVMMMFLPVFLYYLIFAYLPMVGLVRGFEDFRMGSGFEGLFTSKWVGLKWFNQFFSSAFAWRLIRNGIS